LLIFVEKGQQSMQKCHRW